MFIYTPLEGNSEKRLSWKSSGNRKTHAVIEMSRLPSGELAMYFQKPSESINLLPFANRIVAVQKN